MFIVSSIILHPFNGVFFDTQFVKKIGISYGYAIPYQLRLFVSKDVSNFSMLYIIKKAQ